MEMFGEGISTLATSTATKKVLKLEKILNN